MKISIPVDNNSMESNVCASFGRAVFLYTIRNEEAAFIKTQRLQYQAAQESSRTDYSGSGRSTFDAKMGKCGGCVPFGRHQI